MSRRADVDAVHSGLAVNTFMRFPTTDHILVRRNMAAENTGEVGIYGHIWVYEYIPQGRVQAK